MDLASWRIGAAFAAVAGASMALTVWLAAPRDEVRAPVRAAAPAPSLGVPVTASEPGDPSGRWVGAMDLGGGSQAWFRFDLAAAQGHLSGTVSVPVGTAAIVNGRVEGRHLSFESRHRLPATGQEVLIRFSGEVDGDSMALSIDSEGAISHLLLQRASLIP